MKTYLWPTKKKRSWKRAEIVADKLEEKQRGLEQLMKNSWRYDLLGQTLIPSKKPEVNEELLHSAAWITAVLKKKYDMEKGEKAEQRIREIVAFPSITPRSPRTASRLSS